MRYHKVVNVDPGMGGHSSILCSVRQDKTTGRTQKSQDMAWAQGGEGEKNSDYSASQKGKACIQLDLRGLVQFYVGMALWLFGLEGGAAQLSQGSSSLGCKAPLLGSRKCGDIGK